MRQEPFAISLLTKFCLHYLLERMEIERLPGQARLHAPPGSAPAKEDLLPFDVEASTCTHPIPPGPWTSTKSSMRGSFFLMEEQVFFHHPSHTAIFFVTLIPQHSSARLVQGLARP